MTKFLSLVAGLLLQGYLFAQSPKQLDKWVKPKDVSKILGTLASDQMRGRSAYQPQDIIKATEYLEKNFQKIGLEKWPGMDSYRQHVDLIKLETTKLSVQLNGVDVPMQNLLLYSENELVIIPENAPIRYVEAGKNFYQSYRNFTADSTSKIVLVAPAHEKIFNQIKNYFGKPKFLKKVNSNPGNTLFILSDAKEPQVKVQAQQKVVDAGLNNVMGYLKGKTKPNEYVIFSAHYDHIGVLEAVNGDSLANGADDDASGTTAVVSLAKLFKKLNNNQRSIIFVAFTAEEIGGYGSKYFSEQLNPEQIMAMINIEMIGKDSKWGKNSAFITGFERSDLGTIMQKNLAGTAFALHPDPYPEQNLFYRSDNATLARLGVPAHSFSTDQIDSDALYHTVDDEVESLDKENIIATIKALALASKSIVAGIDTPSRIDKSTVK